MDGSRRRGRPHKSWKDNIKEWTGQSMSSLLRIADDRGRWAVIAADVSVGVPQRGLGFSRVLLVSLLLELYPCNFKVYLNSLYNSTGNGITSYFQSTENRVRMIPCGHFKLAISR